MVNFSISTKSCIEIDREIPPLAMKLLRSIECRQFEGVLWLKPALSLARENEPGR